MTSLLKLSMRHWMKQRLNKQIRKQNKMKILKCLKHILTIAIGVFLILGIPFLAVYNSSGYTGPGSADTVSSSTVPLDQPSGEYILLINKETRSNDETLDDWITYFTGGDMPYIFEDITCSVSKSDSAALEMAESYQSKLPEHQMEIQTEDTAMLLSRADNGKFDFIIFSKEYAEANHLETAYNDNVEVVEIKGENE